MFVSFQFPDTREGFTQIVTNDRGHLLEGVPRSSKNPWGDFLGTWDLPRKFVGNVTTYMGRTEEAADEIRAQIGKPVNKSFNKSIPDVPELPKIVSIFSSKFGVRFALSRSFFK